MIKTSRQLKDKIKNLTHGDSLKSQTLLRTYMMERFLERLAVSQYNSHFVLKGGMLVSSMVGIHQRATMDIDTTVVALPLTLEDATRTIQEIINIALPDGVVFSITSKQVYSYVSKIPALKKSKSKETKLSNPVIHDFIALLFLFDKVCTSIETKKHTYETLHDLFHQKFTRNKSFFETNEVLISSYEFVVKIVDFLYNSAYTI